MRRPLFFVLATAVPLLLYARTVTFDYVHADDADLIAANQAFLSDLTNVPRAFMRSYFEVEGDLTEQKTYYRPVAIVSFMLDAARGGADPGVYHATNVVLHAAASGLLLALAVAWGAPWWSALAGALVFAVHPVNVQAVAWIAGRNDLLLAVFGLLALVAFAALKGRAAYRGRGRWDVAQRFGAATLHVVAFALALFSKETGVFFPLVAVLHQVMVTRAPLTRAQKAALALDGAVVVAWALLRARALAGMPSELSAEAARVAVTNAPQLLVHAGKMLAPMRLNVAPGVDLAGLAAGAAAVCLFAWFAWRRMSAGIVGVALAWFLAFTLPTLVVPGLPAYEHRAYVPLIGVLLAVVTIRKPAMYAAVVLVPLFAVLSYDRQEVFRDAFTYWADASRDAQFGPIAHVNLGQLHEAAGRSGDARREYLRALERDPSTPKAHNNLGVVLMQLGEPELAVRHFRQETERHPWNADAWFNLGLWSELQGDEAAAQKYYERAIAASRWYLPAYEKLGRDPPSGDNEGGRR